MSNYHWFNDEEVARWQLDPVQWAMLDMARQKTIEFDPDKKGVPFIITSGRRTADGNSILKGAVPDSSHLTGLGTDLWVPDARSYCLMKAGLYAAGFTRFGEYFATDPADPNNFIPKHLHVDSDASKPQWCTWCKREQN